MEMKKVIQAIENVMCINEIAIIGSLTGDKISDEMIDMVKESCEVLTAEGVYKFDVNESFADLLKQINQFMENS